MQECEEMREETVREMLLSLKSSKSDAIHSFTLYLLYLVVPVLPAHVLCPGDELALAAPVHQGAQAAHLVLQRLGQVL